MSLYGTIAHSGDVFAAVQTHLEAWLTAYLAEMERRTGRTAGKLPLVNGKWHTAAEIEQWFDNKPPAGMIAIPGTLGEPTTVQGVYRAAWDVRVGILVNVGGRGDSEDTAGLYGAAVRAALVQHPALADGIRVEAWLGEDLNVVPRTKTRTLGMTVNSFRLGTAGTLSRSGGPTTPPPAPYDPPSDPPTVIETQVTVDPME